jgi:adenylate kinase family enzyme
MDTNNKDNKNSYNCIDIDNIDDDLKKKIESTKFVYIVALAGVGKTFSGDYLEAVRGWKHIDGDIPFKQVSNPEWLDARQQLMRDGDYAGRGNDAEWVQHESFKAYTNIMVGLTLGGAICSDKVVLTHASYTSEQRRYCKEQLERAGAKEVSTVFLHCDFDAHMETMWKRTNRWANQGGTTVEEVMAGIGFPGVDGFESFVEIQKYMMCFWDEPDDESDQPYTRVDVTAKDVTVLDGLDAALGIIDGENENSGRGRRNFSYPELVQAIWTVDEKRNQAWFDALNASTEDQEEQELARREPQKLAARRTSLLQADKLLSTYRPQDFHFDVGVSTTSSRRLSMPAVALSAPSSGRRRASFITTGKFVE